MTRLEGYTTEDIRQKVLGMLGDIVGKLERYTQDLDNHGYSHELRVNGSHEEGLQKISDWFGRIEIEYRAAVIRGYKPEPPKKDGKLRGGKNGSKPKQSKPKRNNA